MELPGSVRSKLLQLFVLKDQADFSFLISFLFYDKNDLEEIQTLRDINTRTLLLEGRYRK